MGNTHSESPVQRERDLQPQAGQEEASWRSTSNTDEPQRGPPLTHGVDPGVDHQDSGAGQAPVSGTPVVTKVKPGLGKRKITKGQKGASSQLASQEPVGLARERPRTLATPEQARARTSKTSTDSAIAALSSGDHGPGGAAGQEVQPGGSATVEDRDTESLHQNPSDNPSLEPRGQGEPAGATLNQQAMVSKASNQAQLPQGAHEPQSELSKGLSSQTTTNGKESPCRLIRLNIFRPPYSPRLPCDKPRRGQGSGEQGADEHSGPRSCGWEGEPSSPVTGAKAPQSRSLISGPTSSKQALALEASLSTSEGGLNTHSSITKPGARADPAQCPRGSTVPPTNVATLSPSAKAVQAGRRGISYAEVLKQVPPQRCTQESRVPWPELNSARELSEMPAASDATSSASKKKLPFYEQLIASLKSQAQRQKAAKPLRPTTSQEGLASLEATQEVSALPSPELRAKAGAPHFPQPDSHTTFWFPAHIPAKQPADKTVSKAVPRMQPVCEFRVQPEAREQGKTFPAQRGAPVVSPCLPTNPPPRFMPTDKGRPQASRPALPLPGQEARVCGERQLISRPATLSLPSSPQPVIATPPLEKLQAHPTIQSLDECHAEPLPQCWQLPEPAPPAQLHLPVPFTIPQQPPLATWPQPSAQVEGELAQPQKQIQAQASACSTALLQEESKPSAPCSLQFQPPIVRPWKQQRLLPRGCGQEPHKAKSQKQTKGRKGLASCSSLAQELAKEKNAAQWPVGRWMPFQVDKTCTRKCHCRHRVDQGSLHLPRNITTWTNIVREPFCETPWARTAVLAASLVAGTKFCLDHFKANNILN
ncbi:gametogenetin-like [Narcine bancroftii]|uniref:gametogenetin-like n=1 Tax=Narcine bancroftii TaxID=1343680 RepID=UPI00383103B6